MLQKFEHERDSTQGVTHLPKCRGMTLRRASESRGTTPKGTVVGHLPSSWDTSRPQGSFAALFTINY